MGDLDAEKEPFITTDGFLKKQATDIFCQQMSGTVDLPNSAFTYDEDGFLFTKSTVDHAVQRLVP